MRKIINVEEIQRIHTLLRALCVCTVRLGLPELEMHKKTELKMDNQKLFFTPVKSEN